MTSKKIFILIRVILLIFFAYFLSNSFSLKKIAGNTMGTTYSIKYYGSAIEKDIIDKKLQQINEVFSNWQEDSQVSILNRQPINKWLDISDDMLKLIKFSNQIHTKTQGSFDITIGKIINLWGFGVSKVDEIPSKDKLSQIKVGHNQFKLKGKKVYKYSDIYFNLSAIAKGYAVDEIAKLLKEHNIHDFLVEIGGEIRISGEKIFSNWEVAIDVPNSMPIKIELTNKAVATSGNYRNFMIIDGKKYHHIIDPKTNFIAQNKLVSVSIFADNAMEADAWATAAMVLGDNAYDILKKNNIRALLLVENAKNDILVQRVNF